MTNTPRPERIIIDTDPGVDDSMAILLAFNSPEIQIEGLTTVFGNTGTEITTKNALRLVELAGRPDVPVAAWLAPRLTTLLMQRLQHLFQRVVLVALPQAGPGLPPAMSRSYTAALLPGRLASSGAAP